jgi:hypothetical protein
VRSIRASSLTPNNKRKRRPAHGRINKDGSVVDEGLPGWAIDRLFKLQAQLETALPWERAELEAQIQAVLKADYNSKKQN